MGTLVRILLLGDTHLGFDEPVHARVERRRRGAEFFANFERALAPAFRGEVDVVVHGGDVFDHPDVPAAIVEQAFRPFARVGAAGIPVFVVPGNHERSRMPFPLLAVHRNVFVFDRPKTFRVELAGVAVALSGFPFARDVRARFVGLAADTGHAAHADSAVRLLCIHQAVEGAKVGTPEFIFDRGDDVIRGRDLPAGFAAVLSGHIHRGQRLTRALDGRPLAAPVYYPGSVERKAFVERNETKGYLVLHVRPSPEGGRIERHEWFPLPARPMVRLALPRGTTGTVLRGRLAALPPDAVVRVDLADEDLAALTAADLRAAAPPTMNVDLGRRAVDSRRQRDAHGRGQ